jgi:uncharacterized protein (TIGR02246 family)
MTGVRLGYPVRPGADRREEVAMPATSPEEMIRVWTDAFNRGDVDTLVELYEPDATLVRLSAPAAIGRDAIRHAFADLVASRPRIDAVTRKVIEAGDVALTSGEWTLRTIDADGRSRQVTGRSAEVLRRQADGTWRHVIDDPHSG